MPRPIVEIHQEVLNIVLTPADPTMATCIVGPAYDVVDYPADKGTGFAYYADAKDGSSWAAADALEVPVTIAAVQSVPYSTYDFGAGHTVDIASTSAYKPRVFMEDVYVEILGNGAAPAVADCVIDATANTLTSLATNWKVTLGTTGGVAAGDYVVYSSNLIQVFEDVDLGANFLTTVTGKDGTGRSYAAFKGNPDKIEINPSANPGTIHDILSVIDNNRLLVSDNLVNGVLQTLTVNAAPDAAPAAGTSEYEIIYSAQAALPNLVANGDRIKRILHVPVKDKVVSVDAPNKKLTLLNPIKQYTAVAGGGLAKVDAVVRIERKLPATTGATAPGYEVEATSLDITGAAAFLLGQPAGGPIANAIVEGGLTVTRATVHADARGLKIDQPDIHELSEVPSTGKFTTLGDVHQESPLALGVATALANAGTTKIHALALSSDDIAGYTAARAKVNADKNIYCVVPLSTDLANVIAAFKNDAVAVSTPEKSIFRMVVGTSAGLPNYGYVGSVTVGGETDTGIFDVVTNNLTDAGGTFVDDGVVVGDFVVLGAENFGSVRLRHIDTTANAAEDVDEANDYVFPLYLKVSAVVNNQTLSLTIVEPDNVGAGYIPLDVVTANVQTATYTVQRSIAANAASQATALGTNIKAVGDKRLTMVYPNKCTVQGYTDQPGYYLACALGGMMASLSPHQPKNNIGIAGVEQIFNSNLHFDDTQIDTISDSGYFVYVQDSPTGLPYCVHQLTTGQIGFPGVQEFAELSVVQNFDYVSRFFKKRLDPYVGVWNIIPEALGSIEATLRAGILSLLGDREVRIGAPLTSGTVDFVRQSEADAGALEVQVSVGLPKVLNKLEVHLISI